MKTLKILGIIVLLTPFFSCMTTEIIPETKWGYFINNTEDPTGGTNIIKIDSIQFVYAKRDQTPIGMKIKISNISDNSISLLLRDSEFIHGDIRDPIVLESNPFDTLMLGPSNVLIEGSYDKYHNWYSDTFYPKSRSRQNGTILNHVPMNEPCSLLLYFTVYGETTKQTIALDFVRVDKL